MFYIYYIYRLAKKIVNSLYLLANTIMDDLKSPQDSGALVLDEVLDILYM